MFLTQRQFPYFEVTHPNTNLARQGLTLVFVCRRKLSDAQSARSNLWSNEVVRELESDQLVNLETNVSRFPFIFFNLFGI